MKRIYTFGSGSAEGSHSMKDLLGGKGANLAEMSSLGLPVPPGFTIPTDVCMAYLEALPQRTGFGGGAVVGDRQPNRARRECRIYTGQRGARGHSPLGRR